jgi:uncharacterized protein
MEREAMSKTKTQVAPKSAKGRPTDVLFASADVERLESKQSLPAKFLRLIDRLPMKRVCEGAVVAVKVHVGGNLGYTTIPPIFMRLLVQKIKEAGAKSVFLTDGPGATENAVVRGYTAEVLGAPIVLAAGQNEKYVYKRKMNFKTLKELELCGNVLDADALINFSHFKGHGDCGYGAACKNLAMGCVTTRSRGQLHQLEGGLELDSELCIKCKKCVDSCTHNAASWDKEKNRLSIFFHNCTYCRHCMLVCPTKAIKITGGGFEPFQKGMALATKEVLNAFDPQRILHINALMQITMLCDCWGFSTRPLIPDVGILASDNITAVENASLDLTRDGDPLPGSLPKGRELVAGNHLMERIHAKDPYVQIDQLEAVGLGSRAYRLVEVK